MSTPKRGFVNFLQEFSIPLIAGVFAALVFANLAPEKYDYFFGAGHDGDHWLPFGHLSIFGHELSLYFLINDLFMVFFFGIAAKEITEAALPGGALNPLRKAINPLFGTIGGVAGPVLVFFGVLALFQGAGAFPDEYETATLQRGWGVPTATDIALAWLVARAIFGAGHPAVNYLLLLAVADDAIGLGIIAIFYGDPAHPAAPQWLLLCVIGMGVAWGLRRAKVQSWVPYVFLGGSLAWSGLILAHLHPALALVFIVPFLPGPKRDPGMFVESGGETGEAGAQHAAVHHGHSPLENFEHQLKTFVDFGLFFFALGNAGVQFASIGPMTWTILASLVVGKTVGIGLLGWIGMKAGFPLPERMGMPQLIMAGFVAALGLTVALFVAGAAFTDPVLLGQAKMGALFSGFVALVAVPIGKMLRMSGGGLSSAGGASAGEGQASSDQHRVAAANPPAALPGREVENGSSSRDAVIPPSG